MNSEKLKDEVKKNNMERDKTFLKLRAKQISDGIQLATEIKRTLKSYLLLFQVNQLALKKEQFTNII